MCIKQRRLTLSIPPASGWVVTPSTPANQGRSFCPTRVVLMEEAVGVMCQTHFINMSYKEELAAAGERALRVTARQVQ